VIGNSSCLFIYFFTKLDITNLIEVLSHVSFKWIAAGVFFYWVQIVLKAIRFKYILGIENRFIGRTIGVQGGHAILNNILPGGLGEVSILYLFKKVMNINYSKSVSSLFTLRTIDFVLSAMLFALLFLFKSKIVCFSTMLWTIMECLIGISVILLVFTGIFVYSDKFFKKYSESAFINKFNILNRLNNFLIAMRIHLSGFIAFDSILVLSFLTLLIFLVTYFVLVAAAKTLNSGLLFPEIFFVFLMLWPITVLPIKGILNIGSHELGWVVPLMIIGHSNSTAVLIAFGTHTILLLNVLVTAVALLVIYKRDILQWLGNRSTERCEAFCGSDEQ